MNPPAALSILSGCLIGLFYVTGILGCTKVSADTAEWFEKKFFCCLTDTQSFVKTDAAGQGTLLGAVGMSPGGGVPSHMRRTGDAPENASGGGIFSGG